MLDLKHLAYLQKIAVKNIGKLMNVKKDKNLY